MTILQYRKRTIELLKKMIPKAKDMATAISYINEIAKLESLPPVDERKVLFCSNYSRLGKNLR